MKVKVDATVEFSQCLREIISKMGEDKAAEYIINSAKSMDFAEMMAHHASKMVSKQFYNNPDLVDIAPDYAKAINFLAANDPTNL